MVPVFNETHYIINSICLTKTNITNSKRESLVIIGMGDTDKRHTSSQRLKKAVILITAFKDCPQREWYKERHSLLCSPRIRSGQLKPLYNASSCWGDSGSPAHQYFGWQAVQLGITTSSKGDRHFCASELYLIRVSEHMPWIRNVLNSGIKAKVSHLLVLLSSVLYLFRVSLYSFF